MMRRTRYFVVSSLAVLGVGVGTGLVAYYVGFPAGAFARKPGPEELQYVPRNATVVAYANVRDVMMSDVRRHLHDAMPMPENGQREFQEQTGINIENDIDHVVACLDPEPQSTDGAGMVLARGRFNQAKIESLIQQRGGRVESYKGKRLFTADHLDLDSKRQHQLPDSSHTGDETRGVRHAAHDFALAFIEPGLVAVGSENLVRLAIDLRGGGANVTSNNDLMNLVRSLDGGNAWAVGRFEALQAHAHLPPGVVGQLPAITWFSVSGHVDGGIRGTVRAETRDDEAANNLRDVVRGFVALAKMQAGSKPELQTLVQSLELAGTGKTVALSFSVPSELLDSASRARRKGEK